jgi:hypothetical protein
LDRGYTYFLESCQHEVRRKPFYAHGCIQDKEKDGASLLQLLLKQLQPPPSEEVERIAMGMLVADIELRVLIPYQRLLLEEVAQGAVVMFRADIAYV